jgi:hypothetical protein
LKPASGAAGARVVAAELLDQLLLAVHDALVIDEMKFNRVGD